MTTVDPFGNTGTSSGSSGTSTSGFTFSPLAGAQKAPTYIGGGTDVTRLEPQFGRYGGLTGQNIAVPGYVNGDQWSYFPRTAGEIRDLQNALLQAGFITTADINSGKVVFGSPDPTTVTAFTHLLATANFSRTTWKDALATRLAQAAQEPPAQKEASKIPPLTVTVDNPDDIKAIIQQSAQTLIGQNLDPAQADLFAQSIQRQQREAQTSAYYQQYTPTPGDPTTGTYGPGGTTVAAPTSAGVKAQAEAAIKYTNPQQYQATQIGMGLTTALDKLRASGYL